MADPTLRRWSIAHGPDLGHLRMLLATTTLDGAATQMQTLYAVAQVAAMPETSRLVVKNRGLSAVPM